MVVEKGKRIPEFTPPIELFQSGPFEPFLRAIYAIAHLTSERYNSKL